MKPRFVLCWRIFWLPFLYAVDIARDRGRLCLVVAYIREGHAYYWPIRSDINEEEEHASTAG